MWFVLLMVSIGFLASGAIKAFDARLSADMAYGILLIIIGIVSMVVALCVMVSVGGRLW